MYNVITWRSERSHRRLPPHAAPPYVVSYLYTRIYRYNVCEILGIRNAPRRHRRDDCLHYIYIYRCTCYVTLECLTKNPYSSPLKYIVYIKYHIMGA